MIFVLLNTFLSDIHVFRDLENRRKVKGAPYRRVAVLRSKIMNGAPKSDRKRKKKKKSHIEKIVIGFPIHRCDTEINPPEIG